MGLALGTTTPSAIKTGTSDCLAIYVGSTLAWQKPATSTTVFAYDFTGTNGVAWDSSKWTTLYSDGQNTLVDIQSNQGRMSVPSTPYKIIRKVATGLNVRNVEAFVKFTRLGTTEGYIDLVVRQDASKTAGPYPDGYFVSCDIGTNLWTLGNIDMTYGQFNNTDKTITWDATQFAIRLRAVDHPTLANTALISAKVWRVSDGEPTDWQQTFTNTEYNRAGTVELGYQSGNTTNPGILWDDFTVTDLDGGSTTSPAATATTLSDDFAGTNGAAPKAMWKKAQTYPTGPVILQNGAMQLATGSSGAWASNSASIFLGDPSKPEGISSTGVPPIASNFDYTFRYTLLNKGEHYPSIALRARSAEQWPGGDGQNLFMTGTSIVLAPAGSYVEVVSGYNTQTLATISNVTFPSNDLMIRIRAWGKRLAFKIWAYGSTEPGGVGSDTNWTYSNTTILADESDGSIAFNIVNGSAAEQKTLLIRNFSATTPVLSLGTSRTTPAADPSGFTRVLTENFDTAAAAGTSSGQFMAVYANSFQPYNDVSPNFPRQMISAHDGVMDVAMDGVRASAGSFGSASTISRIGGRFAIRMKTIGGFNNGPAFMVWPNSTSDGPWSDGELDFPESVSGRGGTQGFQDSPWVHHHNMTTNMDQAQDFSLGVSWRDWHIYTMEWYPPGKGPTPATGSVRYFIDEQLVFTVTTNVPTTVHRWCFQIGDWGAPGNIFIDWIAMSNVN